MEVPCQHHRKCNFIPLHSVPVCFAVRIAPAMLGRRPLKHSTSSAHQLNGARTVRDRAHWRKKELRYRFPSFVLVVAALLFGSIPAFSQRSEWDGKPVRSLVYVPAHQPLAAEDLVRLQELRVGSAYSSKDAADTIDRLFATGAYAEIQVDVEQEP